MEGIAREIISKIQNMRKSNNYEVMDKIKIMINTDDEMVKNSLIKYTYFINKETVSNKLEFTNDNYETQDINGHDVMIGIDKI